MPMSVPSKSDVAMRCRSLVFSKQDLARNFSDQGMRMQDIARKLDVRAIMVRSMIAVSGFRADIRRSIERPLDFDLSLLSDPDRLLLRAAAMATFLNYERNRVAMPESRVISALAKRSASWAAQAARKRIAMPEAVHPGRPGRPGHALLDVRGNGYMQITDKGWRVCYALFPELFAVTVAEKPLADVA